MSKSERPYESRCQAKVWFEIDRTLRGNARVSRKTIAEALGVSEPTLSRWSSGLFRQGEADTVNLVAYFRSVKLSELADFVAKEMNGELAGLGYALVATEAPVPVHANPVTEMLRLMTSAGDLAEAIEAAFADGKVELHELDALETAYAALSERDRRMGNAIDSMRRAAAKPRLAGSVR